MEHLHFLSNVVLDFKNVGAMLPSSRYLGEKIAKMVAEVAADGDTICELGPGTGAITKEILRSLENHEISFVAIERNERFVEILQSKFPSHRIIHGNAKYLFSHIEENPGRVIIVSSLPFFSMDNDESEQIIDACLDVLNATGGLMLQYTYRRRNPIGPRSVDSNVVCTVYRNIPPATIWRYRPRRQSIAAETVRHAPDVERLGRAGDDLGLREH